jgi:predicted unusual protein kinase regulating ubiquinone biosynthesis (AarF/ABC1/UbiB family)
MSHEMIINRNSSLKGSLETPTAKKHNIINTLKFLVSYQIKSATLKNKKELAKWTKAQVIDLGPTFIKMGQFVSTRADIFDQEIIDELQTLQDKAPPFSGEDAKNIITEQLGRPYYEVFKDFVYEPLASASISQVHRARLISNDKEVVIKVQRPYISEYFDRDFTTLHMIFDFASISNNRSIQDSKILLDDCYKYMYEELAFQNEKDNLLKFQEILGNNSEIIVPKVYPELSTDKIITMEYVPSVKIGRLDGVDRSLLASVLMECFIKQIIEHGIIHADPHPGNIGITKDGKIVLYDFGQVTKLDDIFVKSVKPLLFAVYEKDIDAVGEIMLKTKTIIPTKVIDKKFMRSFIAKIIKYFEDVDFKEFQLSMINSDFEDMELPFKINSKLIMVFRSLSLLEGICKDLDPDFSYFKVINMLMSDVFFDMDYIDHRARKDLFSLFDVTPDEPMETFQTKIEENNRKHVKSMDLTLRQYQKIMILLMTLNVWDFNHIPRSIALSSAFIFLILKVK